jgi:hypothetical protein
MKRKEQILFFEKKFLIHLVLIHFQMYGSLPRKIKVSRAMVFPERG